MKNRSFTHEFKVEVARRRLAGEGCNALARELKLSATQVRSWTERYANHVERQGIAPVLEAQPNPAPKPIPEAPAEPPRRYKAVRVPMTDQRQQNMVGGSAEFLYRGVAEDDRRVGRVESAKLAGWEPVTTGDANLAVSTMAYAATPGATVTRAAGLGTTITLMRKRKEYEEEDLAKLEAENKRKEASIFKEALYGGEGRFGQVTINGHTETR